MKHWFLLAALALMFAISLPAYASPPDPGGTVVSATFTTNTDFRAGGVIERTAAVQSATPWYIAAPMMGLAAVIGTALIALLFVVSVTPYLVASTNSGNTSRPPERYDKAHRMTKRTKSPVLKSA